MVAGMAGAAQVAERASHAIAYLCNSLYCGHSNHNYACLAAADAPKGTFPPSLLLLLFSRCISSSVPFSSCAPFSRCVCLAGLVRVAGQGRGPKSEKSTFPLGGIRLGGIVAPIRVARGKVSCNWPRLKHLKKRDITVSTKNSWNREIFPLFPHSSVFPDFLRALLMAHELRHGLSHHLTPLNSRIDISNRVLKMFSALFSPSVCAALVALLRAFPSEGAGGYDDYGDVAFYGARAIWCMVDSHPACKPLFLSAGAEEALRAIRANTATSASAKSMTKGALKLLGLRV